MNINLSQFKKAIADYQGDCQDPRLKIAASGDLETFYAPFEYVNPTARVVFVGITPGATQAHAGLKEAQRCIVAGCRDEETLRRAKQVGAFSGGLRTNLTSMLDHIGLHRWLGVSSCTELFDARLDLIQSTSVLMHPVFIRGANYAGSPAPMTNAMLRSQIDSYFVPLVESLSQAVYVPLGPVPTAVLTRLVQEGRVDQKRVLAGLPHPSGANAERISYFLGRKLACDLSKKTKATTLDAARADLEANVRMLIGNIV